MLGSLHPHPSKNNVHLQLAKPRGQKEREWSVEIENWSRMLGMILRVPWRILGRLGVLFVFGRPHQGQFQSNVEVKSKYRELERK